MRLRRRGRTARPYIRVSVLLFQRSAPSRSLTATSTIMVNGSLPPVGCPAVLSAPPPDLITGRQGLAVAAPVGVDVVGDLLPLGEIVHPIVRRGS